MTDEHKKIDCKEVENCLQRLIWDVENIQKDVDSFRSVAEDIKRLKWIAVGALGLLVMDQFGLLGVLSRLVG